MTAIEITAMKSFMGALFAGDLFDDFLLEEASIVTANTYTIDGRINQAFFSQNEREDKVLHPYEFTPFKDMRPLCFTLIKGKRTPLSFQLVLHLLPQKAAAILQRSGCGVPPDFIKAFVLTIRFDGEKTFLYSGTSYTTFLPDKEPERLWDNALKQYLTQKGIPFEER